jgi:hypothetical protein
LETLPENFACVDIAAQVQGDIDGERFVASLPPRLRAAVELRLAGYSWDEAAQQLGVSASTLRAKFVDFFGYDPSKRASESLIRAEGKTAPSDDRGGDTDEGDARIGERLGDDTEHAGGGKSPAVVGRAKCGRLRWVRCVLTGSKGRWLMVATLFGFAMPWQRALYALILVVVALFQTTIVHTGEIANVQTPLLLAVRDSFGDRAGSIYLCILFY